MKLAIAALMGLVQGFSLNDPEAVGMCCVKCGVLDEKIKAFSVDPNMNLCGEACMYKKDYWKYHIFEKWLKLADDPAGTPCADLGYT